MASHFRIQKPYELTSLPKSLDQSGDSYVVGEVLGQTHAASFKKRKRSELAVGINGEALNIYDVASSRLITSYPIPPQASFTCPPYSLRVKTADKSVTRYTFSSTLDPKPKVTLYKDSLAASGATTSSSTSHKLPRTDHIVHLSSVNASTSAADATGAVGSDGPESHLVAVTRDGAVVCFEGESLRQIWRSPPDILKQDTGLAASHTLRVEFSHGAPLADVVRGVFGGKDDLVQTFSLNRASESGENPSVLVLLSSSRLDDGKELRHLHIVAFAPSTEAALSRSRGIVQLFVAPLPPAESSSPDVTPSYRIDVSSGSLLELRGETLTVFDISSALPRVESELHIAGATSFLRLTKSSILASTKQELAIYNPLYRSLQVSSPLESSPKQNGLFRLVAHFARLEMVIAVCGSSLIAAQLEAPRARSRKRRAEGLLIDAVGRGILAPIVKKCKPAHVYEATTFSTFTPPSLESYEPGSWTDDAKKAEDAMESGDFLSFEGFMARSFGVDLTKLEDVSDDEDSKMETDGPHTTSPAQNGCKTNGERAKTHTEFRRVVGGNRQPHWVVNGMALPSWKLPASLEQQDRRLVLYAIQKTFSLSASAPNSDLPGWQLQCRLPWSGVLQYLVMAGHVTVSNLKVVLEAAHRDIGAPEGLIAEQLPRVLAEADPTLDLLFAWLSETMLGSVELLSAVKLIMRSLELIQDPERMSKNLLTYHPASGAEKNNEEHGEIGMELDRLEEQLHVTEHYLGDDSGSRAEGLSVAFSKLGSCPSVANVRAIRQIFKPEETLSLIYLLRMELNRDGWTSRYLDGTRLADDDEDDLGPPPDSSIRLIADLLCQCIDAVGPGGWLINDILSLAAGPGDHLDSADFLSSMKLEISAALEGVEEAVYLRGILTEVVKYGASLSQPDALSAWTPSKASSRKALKNASSQALVVAQRQQATVNHLSGEATALPLGSRSARATVSRKKVVSGGEIKRRTMRELGHLTSQKVADYSFERIAI